MNVDFPLDFGGNSVSTLQAMIFRLKGAVTLEMHQLQSNLAGSFTVGRNLSRSFLRLQRK